MIAVQNKEINNLRSRSKIANSPFSYFLEELGLQEQNGIKGEVD
jgi:hypothetical protein